MNGVYDFLLSAALTCCKFEQVSCMFAVERSDAYRPPCLMLPHHVAEECTAGASSLQERFTFPQGAVNCIRALLCSSWNLKPFLSFFFFLNLAQAKQLLGIFCAFTLYCIHTFTLNICLFWMCCGPQSCSAQLLTARHNQQAIKTFCFMMPGLPGPPTS